MNRAILLSALALCPTAFAQSTNGVTLSPTAMTVNYQIGAAALPAAQTLQIQSTPKGLNFSVAISGTVFNAAWLLVSASTGTTPASLKVETNPTGLPAGTYVGTITVTAVSGMQSYQAMTTVTLLVASAASTVTASPSSLNFTYTTGAPVPSPSLSSAFVLSSSGAALSATVSVTGAPWLTVNPSGNISLIGLLNTISVSVNPTGLAPKVYTGTITISAPAAKNKTLSMTVTLTVDAAVPTAVSTWPPGVIQASPQTTVTIDGTAYFANSTVAETGFTPESTVTVTDGVNTTSGSFFIPVYQTTFTELHLAVGTPLPSGVMGTAYSQTLSAAGGTAPYTFAVISGTVPNGLGVSGTALSGTPLAAGTYQFTIQVTDSSSPPVQAYSQVSMAVYPSGTTALLLTPSATALPAGVVGSSYGPVTLAATGGTGGPYTWSATSLPPGLSLSSTGVLSGTPSTDGSGGALTASVVSDTAILATVPTAELANPGMMRLAVTTPGPGGGMSNEAQFQIYGPAPQMTAVVNSASYAQGTIAPGDMIAIFGVGLGPSALTIFDPSTPPIPTALPTTSPSTSVTINGISAPILYTSATQVGVIVPYSVSGPSAQVVVSYGGLASQPVTVAVVAADPGIYSTAASGQGQGAILNFDATTGNYTINSPANSATPGSIIVIYMTGMGLTTSAVDNQLVPASPPVTPILAPTVTIGGQGATVLGAQAPPGSVPGLMQLNVTVPSTLKANQATPVVVTVGGVPSQAGLTMAVR